MAVVIPRLACLKSASFNRRNRADQLRTALANQTLHLPLRFATGLASRFRLFRSLASRVFRTVLPVRGRSDALAVLACLDPRTFVALFDRDRVLIFAA